MKGLVLYPVVIALAALLPACGEPNRRLDEYVFHDGPAFSLKVVRYYRNIPFNYLGEYAVVMCRSQHTAEAASDDPRDAGWRTLWAAGGQDSESARDVALGEQDRYEVPDDHTLIAKTHAFNISFDACGHFTSWDPGRLPHTLIDPVEKPDSCAPNGPADCRHLDFEGDRTPRYEAIDIGGPGQVSFTVRSATFRGVERLRVHTGNDGATWHVETVGPDAGGERLVPGHARSLSVASLEQGLEDASLGDWLESVLSPGSMVIWPDVPGACGERQAAEGRDPSGTCAAIRFSDSAGNSGVIYMDTGGAPAGARPGASFHSAVYITADGARPVGSLTGLRDALAAGTK